MDARTGKRIRLGRLFNQASGKSILIAYSHGVLLGRCRAWRAWPRCSV